MIYFYRKNDCFDDILQDKVLKKSVRTTLKLENYLMLDFDEGEENEKLMSYLNLKYGDAIVDSTQIIPDRSPVMYKDYVPEKKETVYH